MSPTITPLHTQSTILTLAHEVIRIEHDAIDKLQHRLDHRFEQAITLIEQTQGRIVITGMGKSGHIGQKIAATFASTGTPAFFMHPAEGRHGDLGQITPADCVIAISNSGESDEVIGLLPTLHTLGVPLIAMTAKTNSTLGKQAKVVLDISVEREACPLALAPTASTTVTLVLGDALAMVLMQRKGFAPKDFALFHPAGSLGKRLLLKVDSLMHQGDELPLCPPETPLLEALLLIGQKKLGLAVITTPEQHVLGILTDGDIRRFLATHPVESLSTASVAEAMTKNPLSIPPTALAHDALHMMEKRKITALLVTEASNTADTTEERQIVGILHLHDLLNSGL
jgi:arabinose-5-phosphate isomerase